MSRSLTANFTLGELTKSSALDNYNASHKCDFKNEPNSIETKNLLHLCQDYLQPLRDEYGPITINSAYRTSFVNDLIHGARGSYHMKGLAADIHCASWREGFLFAAFFIKRWMNDGKGFNELILSRRAKTNAIWLHLAVPAAKDMQSAQLKCTFLSY